MPKTLKEREKEFGELMKPFATLYDRQMLVDFFSYWTEPNKSQTKMKFELEKTWDISRRLSRWFRNNKKWHNGSTVNWGNNAGNSKLGTSDARVEALKNW